MATPRPHGQTPDAFRRELQRLRAQLDELVRAGGSSTDLTDILADIADLEARVTALEAVAVGDTTSIWLPDAPPASPEAEDDEFTAGSLDAKWSEWDPGTLLTVSMDTDLQAVKLVGSGNGGARLAGIYQPVPDSEFAVYTKVSLISELQRGGVGLFVAADIDGDPSNADAWVAYALHVGTTALPNIGHQLYTSYTVGSTSNLITNYGRPGLRHYIRIRANGTAVSADFSEDGIGWSATDTSPVTLGFTPAYFGLFLYTFESGEEFIGRAEFFRVFSGASTSGIDDTRIGRRVRVLD